MSKRFAVLAPCLVSLLFLAILTVAPSAPAHGTPITYAFTAMSQLPSEVTDFTLRYRDNDEDGRFDLSELLPDTFSGMTDVIYGSFYAKLVGVPVNSTQSPQTDGTLEVWQFRNLC
jgi:hypothetical protein